MMILRLQWMLLLICYSKGYAENENATSHCNVELKEDDICTVGCKLGYQGPECNETCPNNCAEACSQDSGNCLSGCKPNWFTANCSQSCSGNCVDNVCDGNSGECINGCKDGFYGEGCNSTCSGNCTEGRCDINGGCRCKKNVLDESCYINCDDCVKEECVVNAKGQVTCRHGCKEGQTGSLCKELAYAEGSLGLGPQLPPMRRKRREASLFPKTRHCHGEDDESNCLCCEEKWRGPDCDIKCPACRYSYKHNCTLACSDGYFGRECNLPCPANCSRATNGRSRCDGNGICDSGCQQGLYGFVCQNTCPKQCNARTCFMNNGSCTDECVPGYWGPMCDRQCGNCEDTKCQRDGTCTCMKEYYGTKCQDRCSNNCQSGNCRINKKGNHVCIGDCQPSYTGDDCLSRCPRDCYNSNCDKLLGVCDAVPATTGDDRRFIADIVGSICGTIVGAAGIFAVVFFWRRHSSKQGIQKSEQCTSLSSAYCIATVAMSNKPPRQYLYINN